MKGKQIGILLVLLFVVGGVALILQKRNQSQWSESATSNSGKIADFPVNDVVRVAIRSSKGTVHLEKKKNVWVVTEKADYPADFQRVSSLIRELWELQPVQQMKIGPSQLGRLELLDPDQGANAGMVVELKNADDKMLAKLVIGKRIMAKDSGQETFQRFPMPMGRYVLASNDGGTVSLVNQRLEFDTRPESWLKHDFIKIENPQSISLSGQTEPRHWTLTRGNAKADWKLANAKPNEEVNNATANSFTSLLTSLRFGDVLPPDAKLEEHGLDKPDTLTVQTFDRFTYTLKIGKPANESYPVSVTIAADPVKERTPAPEEKPEDKPKLDEQFKTRLKQLEEKAAAEKECEQRIYLIPKTRLDPFLKDRNELLAKPTLSATPSPSAHKKR
ncbi:MAG TPA: DUF4340 domain-containing protein [Candidatus Udaeobacter sp.]|nr:DUF4340 domain-containing protein [Candidatus Udaeobacter sp.]